MSFLNPYALLLLGFAPAIVALYLRRRRRERIEVPALFLWPDSPPLKPAAGGFRRIADPLSLFLQLCALTLATLAAARPVFTGLSDQQAAIIVADRSGRMMAAMPEGGRRADQVVARVSALIEAFPDASLTGFASTPELLSDGASAEGGIPAAFDALAHPSAAAANRSGALKLASDLARAKGDSSGVVIHWVSDQPPEPAQPKSGDVEIMYHPVGAPADNVCISTLSARPSENDSGEFGGFVEVRNHSATAWAGSLKLEYDGLPHEVWPLELPPGGSWRGSFSGQMPGLMNTKKGLLRARIESAREQAAAFDAIAVDNVAFAVIPPLKRRSIALIQGGDPFFERALRADPLGEITLIPPDNAGVARLALYDLAAFSAAGRITIEDLAVAGSFRALISGMAIFGISQTAGAEAEGTVVVRVEEPDHPLLRGVDLSTVRLMSAGMNAAMIEERLETLRAAGWRVRPVASAGSAPFLIAAEQDRLGSRLVFLVSGEESGDLPLRVAYPLLIANAVRWLTTGESISPDRYFPDQNIHLNPGETLLDATGEPSPNPPETPGFYQVARAGVPQRWVAVTVDADAISDTLNFPKAESPGRIAPPGEFSVALSWRTVWTMLAAAALAVLVLDWELQRRRA